MGNIFQELYGLPKNEFTFDRARFLRVDDFNEFFDLLNFVTAYHSYDDGDGNFRCVFQANEKDKCFSTHFDHNNDADYAYQVYELIDNIMMRLPSKVQNLILEKYYDANLIENSLHRKFSRKIQIEALKTMNQAFEVDLSIRNVRPDRIEEGFVALFFDCSVGTNYRISFSPSNLFIGFENPNPTRAYADIDKDLFKPLEKQLKSRFPDICLSSFANTDSVSFRTFFRELVMNKYIQQPEYSLITVFDPSKRIPDSFFD